MLASRDNQVALLEREVKGVRDLVEEGYAPFNRQMELERGDRRHLGASTADVQANLARAQSAILELRQRAQVLRSDYRKEVDTQLADVRRDVQAEAERFKALTEELARTEIRTPATGQVVGLAIQTVGGVVQAGQKLMDIVPQNEAPGARSPRGPASDRPDPSGRDGRCAFLRPLPIRRNWSSTASWIRFRRTSSPIPQTNVLVLPGARVDHPGGHEDAGQAPAAAGNAGRSGHQDRRALGADLSAAPADQARFGIDEGGMTCESTLRKPLRRALIGALLGAGLHAAPAAAIDLLRSYELALINDGQLKVAKARADAGREALPQATAQLLPQRVVRLRLRPHRTGPEPRQRRRSRRSTYPSASGSLTLRQPIFRWNLFSQYEEAKSKVQGVDAQLDREYPGAGRAPRVDLLRGVVRPRQPRPHRCSQKATYEAQLRAAKLALSAGIGHPHRHRRHPGPLRPPAGRRDQGAAGDRRDDGAAGDLRRGADQDSVDARSGAVSAPTRTTRSR